MKKVPFKNRLVQIVKDSGESGNKNSARMGLYNPQLWRIIHTNQDVQYRLMERIAKNLGRPAPVVFYRESDGNLVDLGIEDFSQIGTIDNYIGRAIKECRMTIGLNQKNLAKKAEVDNGDLCKYEAGTIKPLSLAIDKISAALRIAPDYLPERIYRVHPGFAEQGIAVLAEPLIVAP